MLLPRQIENRHILWSALAMLALGLIVPGVFGVKPPQWFAVPQQQEPGQNLAAGSAPTKAQIPATKTKAKIPDAGATAGITSAHPDADQDAMSEQSSLLANPAIVMVPADFARRIPERHLALSGADQKQSFINLLLPLIVASNDELVQRRNAVKAAFDAKNRAMLEKWQCCTGLTRKSSMTPNWRSSCCAGSIPFRWHWHWRKRPSNQAGGHQDLP